MNEAMSTSARFWCRSKFEDVPPLFRRGLKTQETSMRPFVHSTRHLHWTDVGLSDVLVHAADLTGLMATVRRGSFKRTDNTFTTGD